MRQRFQEQDYSKKLDLHVWKKYFRMARPYRKLLVILASLSALLALSETGFPLVTRMMFNELSEHQENANVLLPGILYFLLATAYASSVVGFIWVGGRISTNMSHDVRQAGFEKLQSLSFSYFDQRPVGWLVARLTGDSDRLSRILAWGTLEVVWGICLAIVVTTVILCLNWKIGLMMLVVVPPMVLVSMVFQKYLLRSSRKIRKTNSTITADLGECIMGVRTTKSLLREQANLHEFQEVTQTMYRCSVQNTLLSAAYLPIALTLGSVAIGIALWKGGHNVIGGTMKLGDLVAFLHYAALLFVPIQDLARVFAEIQSTQAAAERVVDLLSTEPKIKDSPEVLQAIEQAQQSSEAGTVAIDGRDKEIETVEFNNVSFTYEKGQKVLADFNLKVRRGQTIALVGPTGGGKTTIVSLLCRFYQPTAGQILINGVDYRQRSLQWLQSNLGMVLQTPHVFTGTIIENIRYGRLDATNEEVIAAARLVRAHGFIETLSDGYESRVGEGGVNLSTGQKQLISFARAVLADPQLFVMDEATSSIDTETEQRIQEGLHEILQGRLSFIIAHRLSTIRSADLILVIKEGQIVEQGNHHDLILGKGHYYELYTNQFTQEKENEILA